MKVILIKDCKEGKANTIVEVSNGYGSNFLVKNGFALPYNEKTAKSLERKLQQLSADEHAKRSNFLKIKEELETLTLKFVLKAAVDKNFNLHVHKSVSTKEVHDELKKLGYNLPKHALEKIHFVSEGTHEVNVNLYKDIHAIVRLEISINVAK
ncbi:MULTISPECIES: 50S ribosomal protein L9 [unclassified Mycoplasma]|uniref:50S ribosomal protein L9 n=1 Tax=unclassified Mycoplasma TaxID=2683645 RepID=UPI00211C133B|nr:MULTISPECIES: 50S ribosomal protein L9 [unclassified Mycoplasma]UUM19710.1 50S ribosomal protein L9 [Mycoplasma sp. 1578d]UUM24693.1 50S ribosomal protein L9 [Mycoplasma sp. 3686d]